MLADPDIDYTRYNRVYFVVRGDNTHTVWGWTNPEAPSGDSTPERQNGAMRMTTSSGHAADNRERETYSANSDLDRLESWLTRQDAGRWLRLEAAVLANWVPLVVRFSYRMEKQY